MPDPLRNVLSRVSLLVGGLLLAALACDSGGGSSPTSPDPPQTRAACLERAVFEDPAVSPYCLPYPPGEEYTVGQSYCSEAGWSHNRRYAYDFMMPMGAEVVAARAGVVVELREHFPDEPSSSENVLILRHSDDSLGVYIHMQQNGVLVEMGEFVPQGGLLGFSGMSGTTIPHLHFQVCLRGGECSTATREITLPVNFRNARGALDERGGLVVDEQYFASACA